MKIILLLLITLPMVIMSCFAVGKHCQYADEVMYSYSKKMKKEKDLHAFGMGGELMTNVKVLTLKYLSDRKTTVDEARLLVVDCVEGLLKDVNNHKGIRPYLNDYPFTAKNLEFGIIFMDDNGDFIEGDKVLGSVSMIKDQIYYREGIPKTNRFKKVHEETYEEALGIVREGEAK